MVGKVEKAIRRIWVENPDAVLSTADLIKRVYPGTKSARWRALAVRRAARKFAVRVGRSPRGRGLPVLFRPNDALARLITGK